MDDLTTGASDEEDDDFQPLDAGVEEAPPPPRRRVSLSDDQGQSAKLALVEARVELDDLRKSLVEANAERGAERLEERCERDVAARAAQRHEETVLELRRQVEAVRSLLESEVASGGLTAKEPST